MFLHSFLFLLCAISATFMASREERPKLMSYSLLSFLLLHSENNNGDWSPALKYNHKVSASKPRHPYALHLSQPNMGDRQTSDKMEGEQVELSRHSSWDMDCRTKSQEKLGFISPLAKPCSILLWYSSILLNFLCISKRHLAEYMSWVYMTYFPVKI